MYSDNKYQGDHASVAEELLLEVPELEQKCRAVEKAVKEGYFTLQEAFSAYKVSEIEYIPYFLIRHNEDLKRVNKQEQAFETVYAIVSIFGAASNTFDQVGKQAMVEIKKLTETVSSNKGVLQKIN